MSAVRNDRGFVLSLVIFAVAALSIAGTALFLVVQSETAMANTGAESSTAFHLANAGLARYMGETLGEPRDEVEYEMGGGTVTVTATRVMALGDTADLYLIESEAEVPVPGLHGLVTRREVQQFARLRLQPFDPVAAVVLPSGNTRTQNVDIEGRDQCAARDVDVAGIAQLGPTNHLRGTINGNPAIVSTSYGPLMEDIGLDWNALKDPAFEFEYEDRWPPFLWGSIPDDEYPTIRIDGDLRLTRWHSGRGLLVVTGELVLADDFDWDGAILAGSLPRTTNAEFTLNGTLMTGFEGSASRLDLREARIQFDSCKVLEAAKGIAMFSPVSNTWWETSD